MARGWGGAATINSLATGEENTEERAQSGGGGSDNSDADLNGGPDGDVHSGVEEVVNVGHAADEWNADDCSG